MPVDFPPPFSLVRRLALKQGNHLPRVAFWSLVVLRRIVLSSLLTVQHYPESCAQSVSSERTSVEVLQALGVNFLHSCPGNGQVLRGFFCVKIVYILNFLETRSLLEPP